MRDLFTAATQVTTPLGMLAMLVAAFSYGWVWYLRSERSRLDAELRDRGAKSPEEPAKTPGKTVLDKLTTRGLTAEDRAALLKTEQKKEYDLAKDKAKREHDLAKDNAQKKYDGLVNLSSFWLRLAHLSAFLFAFCFTVGSVVYVIELLRPVPTPQFAIAVNPAFPQSTYPIGFPISLRLTGPAEYPSTEVEWSPPQHGKYQATNHTTAVYIGEREGQETISARITHSGRTFAVSTSFFVEPVFK